MREDNVTACRKQITKHSESDISPPSRKAGGAGILEASARQEQGEDKEGLQGGSGISGGHGDASHLGGHREWAFMALSMLPGSPTMATGIWPATPKSFLGENDGPTGQDVFWRSGHRRAIGRSGAGWDQLRLRRRWRAGRDQQRRRRASGEPVELCDANRLPVELCDMSGFPDELWACIYQASQSASLFLSAEDS